LVLAAVQCSASEFCPVWHPSPFFSELQLVVFERIYHKNYINIT